MRRPRDIALIYLREPEHAAETIAHALRSRAAAIVLLTEMIRCLQPPPAATLFDDRGGDDVAA